MPHEPGSIPNRGAAALEKALAARNMSQGQLARRLGVGADVVGRWVRSAHRPRADLAMKIAAELPEVDAASWWQDEPAPADPCEEMGQPDRREDREALTGTDEG